MEVNAALGELAARGIGVVAIGFSPQVRLDALARDLGLRFPVIADPQRRWYAAFAVPKGSWRAVLAPRILRRYGRAILRRERIPLSRENLRQLGAGLLLRGPAVVTSWISDESERRPGVAEVIAAAR